MNQRNSFIKNNSKACKKFIVDEDEDMTVEEFPKLKGKKEQKKSLKRLLRKVSFNEEVSFDQDDEFSE
jgi:hypothetical protein